jgi:hypothetical protein
MTKIEGDFLSADKALIDSRILKMRGSSRVSLPVGAVPGRQYFLESFIHASAKCRVKILLLSAPHFLYFSFSPENRQKPSADWSAAP